MRDRDCVELLRWALPRLGMRWAGFRKVRRQVCRRIVRRMEALGIEGPDGYRRRLADEPGEWRVLDRMCRVTISRFWRDRGTFEALEREVLPAVAAGAAEAGRRFLDVWSCGCASGEEPHSVSILWSERLAARFPGVDLRVLATDVDLHLLRRAGRAVYPAGATKELPGELAAAAFERLDGDRLRLRDRYRTPVHRVRHDVRSGVPGRSFDLVLCRNLVFTYFEEAIQLEIGARCADSLRTGGAFVIGGHEALAGGVDALEPWGGCRNVFRRSG